MHLKLRSYIGCHKFSQLQCEIWFGASYMISGAIDLW